MRVMCYSELQSCREVYQKSYDGDVLLIMQCDSGHMNGDLIACARYRIDDIINEELKYYQLQQTDLPLAPGLEEEPHPRRDQPKGCFHVLFTIYLPRKYIDSKSSFVSFLGGDWICTHIDDFFPTHPFSPISLACNQTQLSDVFHHLHINPHVTPGTPGVRATAQQLELDKERASMANFKLYVHIQEAVKKAGHLRGTGKRMQEVNKLLLKLLRDEINSGKCIKAVSDISAEKHSNLNPMQPYS